MTEQEIGRKIGEFLDLGLDDMKQSTLNSLQSARRIALENYQMAEEVIVVGQGNSASAQTRHHSRMSTRKLLSVLALLFALTSVVYWQSLQHNDEGEDIDIMLLLDDLPVNAYLDDEFDAWLEGSGQ